MMVMQICVLQMQQDTTDIPSMDRRTKGNKRKLHSQQLLVKFAAPQSPAVTTYFCARCEHGIVQPLPFSMTLF
jgi:hypothetical protein